MKYDSQRHGSRVCYTIGHEYEEEYNHWHCRRCGLPEYASEQGYDLRGVVSAYRWRVKDAIRRVRQWAVVRCDDPECGKIERVMGVRVGDHSKCSPFPF